MKNENQEVPFSFRMPADLKERLQILADKNDRSTSSMVRVICESYLKNLGDGDDSK